MKVGGDTVSVSVPSDKPAGEPALPILAPIQNDESAAADVNLVAGASETEQDTDEDGSDTGSDTSSISPICPSVLFRPDMHTKLKECLVQQLTPLYEDRKSAPTMSNGPRIFNESFKYDFLIDWHSIANQFEGLTAKAIKRHVNDEMAFQTKRTGLLSKKEMECIVGLVKKETGEINYELLAERLADAIQDAEETPHLRSPLNLKYFYNEWLQREYLWTEVVFPVNLD